MNYFVEYFDHFSFNDAIDILIVAFIAYRFLLIVQGTRAVQMLAGVAALFTLFWSSLYYELYALNWVLNHFFDYFFIILIILFQDQFKTALAAFGETGKLFTRKSSLLNNSVEEVVAACMALSQEKIGALMVFERQHGLLNYTLTGTALECKIHSDIIYSIFLSSSPLHDGAIIIEGNKIKAAGCFLPLSKNVEIERHLGTRHRAAIGLTKVSDAVVVVVSEETGKINLSASDTIHAVDTEEELRSGLRLLLATSATAYNVQPGKGVKA